MQELLTKASFKNIAGLVISLLLIVGFLYARAIHSVGILLMGLFWVAYNKETLWLFKDKWFLSLFVVIFSVPLFDFINGSQVDNAFYIKLSLPLYPLFFFAWNPSQRFISFLNRSIFIIFFVLAIESILRYLANPELVIQGYKTAKVLSIGYYSDHIRISVFIAVSCMLALYEYYKNAESFLIKSLLIFYIIFQAIFIHFLSARTGLVVFYVSMFSFLVILLWKKKSVITIIALASVIVLPFISMKVFPSFYNRMGYTFWDKGFYEKMEYREGSSDGLRYFSIVAGIDIFKSNVANGVGFNDLHYVSHDWLKNKFPTIKEYELLQPSSQILIYAASAGLAGLLLIMAYFGIPFFDKTLLKDGFFISLYLGLTATFLFEIFLENQYGSFVFGFCVYWAYFLAKREEQKYI